MIDRKGCATLDKNPSQKTAPLPCDIVVKRFESIAFNMNRVGIAARIGGIEGGTAARGDPKAGLGMEVDARARSDI